MRVTIMQPAYLPWPGYIQRAMHADVHVALDHVKIDWHSKTQFTNRNRILTANGPAWLSIPLSKKDSGDMLINEIRISGKEPWMRKHWLTLSQSYAKAPCFSPHEEFFRNYYQQRYDLLLDALEAGAEYLLAAFGCGGKLVKSSTLNVSGHKNELVLNLCKALNADTYISGSFGRDYLNLDDFGRAGIKVLFHDFTPFAYPQTQPGFTPFLSAVDMLFNIGSEEAGDRLRSSITLTER